jgi:hypothetical protein
MAQRGIRLTYRRPVQSKQIAFAFRGFEVNVIVCIQYQIAPNEAATSLPWYIAVPASADGCGTAHQCWKRSASSDYRLSTSPLSANLVDFAARTITRLLVRCDRSLSALHAGGLGVISITGPPLPETDAAASGIARRLRKAVGPCARVCTTSRRARFTVPPSDLAIESEKWTLYDQKSSRTRISQFTPREWLDLLPLSSACCLGPLASRLLSLLICFPDRQYSPGAFASILLSVSYQKRNTYKHMRVFPDRAIRSRVGCSATAIFRNC